MTPIHTVLVVDDNDSNRALVGATLEGDGYHVAFATDGEAAVSAFERLQPQCILLDVRMPGIGGIEACRRIRGLVGGQSVAIIFVTAMHDVDTFDRAMSAGGDDFVTKPYRPSEIALRIQTAVRLRCGAHESKKLCEAIKDQRDDLHRLQLQMSDANEKLLVSAVQAAKLIDDANAARAAATREEERFRTLVMTSSALLWRASADGRVQIDHDVWANFTGFDLGQGEWDFLEAVHPDDQERVRATWTHAATSATHYECRHRIRRAEGTYAWMQARAVPIAVSGHVREWVGMLTDITDSVRIEEARDRFIGILGHDLRTPLSAILMGAELLEDSESQPRVIAQITRSAHRMDAMIHDVLDFARGRLGGGIPIAPTACDLGVLCDEAITEMQQAYPDRRLSFQGVGDLRGEWDPSRIEQVLSNLLGNAIQHGAGAIEVKSQVDGDEIVTTVHNHGLPIPARQIPSLFEPFAAEASGVPGVRVGLGLGLYIASEIVRAHRGSITATSGESEGTTFMIRLPRRSHSIDTARR